MTKRTFWPVTLTLMPEGPRGDVWTIRRDGRVERRTLVAEKAQRWLDAMADGIAEQEDATVYICRRRPDDLHTPVETTVTPEDARARRLALEEWRAGALSAGIAADAGARD